MIYHVLVPHPAFSPVPDAHEPRTLKEQSRNEGLYRQLLVQGVLAVLLPSEDLGNACLRTLVTDIVGEMILGNGIGGKACQGWLIWEGITRVVENIKAHLQPKATGEEIELDTRSRLEKFGLLSDKDEKTVRESRRNGSSAITGLFWPVLQYCYLGFIGVRFLILGLVAASSSPSRAPTTSTTRGQSECSANGRRERAAATAQRPIVSFKISSLIASLLDLPERTPWLYGSMCLTQHHLVSGPLRLGATDGLVDK